MSQQRQAPGNEIPFKIRQFQNIAPSHHSLWPYVLKTHPCVACNPVCHLATWLSPDTECAGETGVSTICSAENMAGSHLSWVTHADARSRSDPSLSRCQGVNRPAQARLQGCRPHFKLQIYFGLIFSVPVSVETDHIQTPF